MSGALICLLGSVPTAGEGGLGVLGLRKGILWPRFSYFMMRCFNALFVLYVLCVIWKNLGSILDILQCCLKSQSNCFSLGDKGA